MNALYGLSELECVCRGCETDAVCRTALWASRTNGLAASRRPASRSHSRGNHAREVSYADQCIRRRVLTYLVVATPTPRPLLPS